MNLRFWVVLLTGVSACAADGRTQEFKLSDVAALADVKIDQLKPRTIVFADRPGEQLADPDSGLIRFEDWARQRPLQKQMLSLYPDYAEPLVEVTVDGVMRKRIEKLQMYVAEARVALDRAPETLDLAAFVALPFLEKIDPAIKHTRIAAPTQVPPYNQSPQRRWCESRTVSICIQSRYQLEGRLPLGITLANKLREGTKPISSYMDFESELSLLGPAEIAQAGLSKLTGLDTPVIGALEQNIFSVNQMMRFGKLLAVFQRHPADPSRTVASVYVALAVDQEILAKKKEFAKIPVLRNLVPSAVLAGKSSFNSGNSISAGLPVYARNQVKAIAALIERK
jgi:hypothetical protein